MKKVYYFTNISPHYRKNLWVKLVSTTKFEMHFFFGTNESFGIWSIDFDTAFFRPYWERFDKIKNYWFKSRVLFWQKGVIGKCLRDDFDTVIFLGEASILSTWLATLICKLRKKRVIYWTHGAYGNETWLKLRVKLLFYSMADELLVYENRARQNLIAHHFEPSKIHIIYNSLDYDEHLKIKEKIGWPIRNDSPLHSFEDESLPLLIFVGRLTLIKKLDLLIKALKQLRDRKFKLNLLIIGNGDAKENLQDLTRDLELGGQVCFYGPCYDEYRLGIFLTKADLCVSPGNVGLTAIHAMTFGTPVCTHNNFSEQMPEVEAIKEGITGCFFNQGDANDLAETIHAWFLKNTDVEKVRDEAFNVIKNKYNPYNQLAILTDVIGR